MYDYCKSAKIFDWNKILSLISKIKIHLMGLNLTVICRITLVEKIYILIGFDLAVNGMVINKLTYYQNYPHMPHVQLMYIQEFIAKLSAFKWEVIPHSIGNL